MTFRLRLDRGGRRGFMSDPRHPGNQTHAGAFVPVWAKSIFGWGGGWKCFNSIQADPRGNRAMPPKVGNGASLPSRGDWVGGGDQPNPSSDQFSLGTCPPPAKRSLGELFSQRRKWLGLCVFVPTGNHNAIFPLSMVSHRRQGLPPNFYVRLVVQFCCSYKLVSPVI